MHHPEVQERGARQRGEGPSSLRRETFSETSEPRLIAVSSAQAHALANTRLVSVTAAGPGQAVVEPLRQVGAVRVGDLQVEVWPKDKVKLGHLLFMLGYAANAGFLPDTITAEGYDDLWPVLAESVARLTERALMGGVLQGYRRVDEASTIVRGRIRISDQLRRHPGTAFPLEVSYDEYSTDVAENRILRTALRRMRAVPRIAPATNARLVHLDNRLNGVQVLRPGDRLPTWRPTRLNARYAPALRLAELVLRHASAQGGDGDVEIAAFVVSMWKVFEDFITTALREALAAIGLRAVLQYPRLFDEPRTDGIRRVPMAIDLLAYDGAQPVMIYDAKYKAASADGSYPNADLYQMLAYCTATGLPEAVLVYAAGGEPVRRRVVGAPIIITEWPLDLSEAPHRLLAQIADIASVTTRQRMSHAAS